MYSAMASTGPMTPWVQSHYDGPSPSASPSAFSGTPPPVDLESPPHISLGAYSQHEQAVSYDSWNTQMSQIVSADGMGGTIDDLQTSFNHQLDMSYPISDYSCGLEQSQLYDNSSCTLEGQYNSLADDLNMPMEIRQY